MISMEFYDGAGLGNQIWLYVVAKTIAADKGYDFGVERPEKFKAKDFLDIDFGVKVEGIENLYEEKKLLHPLSGADIRVYDKNLPNIADNTKIEGYVQDEQYIIHRKAEIKKWLAVKKEYECFDYSKDDICVINFRGTGYVQEKDFFLRKKYWKDAVANMRKINPNFKFVVVTEDVRNAKKFFPNFEVNHWNIAKDYVVIKNARYLIMSNSSFAQFPVWTSDTLKYVIAPKYWGRHNISDGYWSLGYNIMTGLTYQDRRGNLQSYDECLKELKDYAEKNKKIFSGEIPYRPSFANGVRNISAIFKAYKKESSAATALYEITALVGAKTVIAAKRKIWKTFGPTTKNKFVKSARRFARRILDIPGRAYREIGYRLGEYKAKKTWLSPAAIAEYRKKIKIYDVFTFFNELDLLEIRLNILDPYVDYFVLVEATQTHSGNPKPLYFSENKARFKKWEKKIIYLSVTDVPKDVHDLRKRLLKKDISAVDKDIIEELLAQKNIDTMATHWVKEGYIKTCVKRALVGLNDDDFCFISDLDEIWNPEILIDYSKDSVFKPKQKAYMYYLNNRSNEDWLGWTGTIATKYKNIRTNYLDNVRRIGRTKHVVLSNGGWHFTFQGGLSGAKRKLDESAHPFYGSSEVTGKIEDAVKKNYDYKGRNIRLWKSEKGLPKYLLENKEKYKGFFKQ